MSLAQIDLPLPWRALRPFNLGVFEDGMGFLIHRHEIGLSILEREHLSQHAFETAGYGVTTPFDEWNYVLHENNPEVKMLGIAANQCLMN